MSEQKMRKALEALRRARDTAMFQTVKAPIPLCAEFGGIAQDLDFVIAALTEQPAQGEAEEPLEYLLNVCRTSPSLSNQEIIDQMRNVFDSAPELTVFMETCGDCDPCIGGRPDQCAVGGYPVLNTPPAPSVPEMRANESPYHDAVLARTYAYGWNACRDAMLVAASEASK